MMVGVAEAAAVGESLHPAQSQDSSKNFGFIQVSRKSRITGGCQGQGLEVSGGLELSHRSKIMTVFVTKLHKLEDALVI